MTLETTYHPVDNGKGWLLSVRQSFIPERLVKGRRPLLIVPGYGMNSFIFGWHPNGKSMIEFLSERGFEVWTVDFRGQGRAVCRGGRKEYTFADIALCDLEHAVDAVLRRTQTGADRVDGIGCSLGGTYLYVHVALRPAHRFGALVGMGAPLRWDEANPLARALFFSPWLAGKIPMAGIRTMASSVLPLALKVPKVLHIYMHPEMIDTTHLDQLLQAVDDPNPKLNEDMAWWFKRRDILLEGRMVSQELRQVTIPYLCMVGNADGIVPEEAARAALTYIGTPESKKAFLRVGDGHHRFAHADMFISTPAPSAVFDPLATWLEQLYPSPSSP